MHLYVGLDGVLADFAADVRRFFPTFIDIGDDMDPAYEALFWEAVRAYQASGGRLWYELDLMQDAVHLWTYLQPYTPCILTATGPRIYNGASQKRAWVYKYFGVDVVVQCVEKSRQKARYAHPEALLIDDRAKAILPWRDAGGIGILHTSAADTIAQIQALGL